MKELFEHLQTLLLIILPIVFTLVGAIVRRKYAEWKTTRFKLVDHPMFADLRIALQELHTWRPEDNRAVFIIALDIKLRTWIKCGLALAEDLQNSSYSNTQLKNKILTWAAGTVEDYTDQWREIGIPDKIIDRIASNHQPKVEQFLSEIRNVSYNNDMYPFKMQKSITVLNTLRLLLVDTKNDFNTLIYRKSYNGYFRGCTFRGVPLNDKEYEEYKLKNKI